MLFGKRYLNLPNNIRIHKKMIIRMLFGNILTMHTHAKGSIIYLTKFLYFTFSKKMIDSMKKINSYISEWNYKSRLVGYDWVAKIYVLLLFSCVLINNIYTWFNGTSAATSDWGIDPTDSFGKTIFIYLFMTVINLLILYISLIPALYILKFNGFNDWNSMMTRYSNKLQEFFHPKNKRITYPINNSDENVKNWDYWKFDHKTFRSERPNFSLLNMEFLYVLIPMLLIFEYKSLELYFKNSTEIAILHNQGKSIIYGDYFGRWGFESFFNSFLRTFFERKGMFDSNFSPFERFCDFGWIVLFCQLAYRFIILPFRIKMSFKDDFNKIRNSLKEESSELKRSCYECGEHIIIWAKKCPKCHSKQKAI
jgi:hypothetical protein